MMTGRQWRPGDRWVIQLDGMLRTLVPGALVPGRPSPALGQPQSRLSRLQRQQALAMLRYNHSSEIRAQGCHHGQGLIAREARVSQRLSDAADGRRDHLAWCEGRIRALEGHVSPFNPLYYAASFGVGVMLGRISDPISLGMVHAASELATTRFESQLQHLPREDLRTKAIIERMRDDSIHHAHGALEAGGRRLPGPLRWGLSLASRALAPGSRLEK